MESNIVKSYEWNEWELRRKAIKLVGYMYYCGYHGILDRPVHAQACIVKMCENFSWMFLGKSQNKGHSLNANRFKSLQERQYHASLPPKVSELLKK